ncbi:MAG TPA: LacI family DNA-binding transcriptional regulator [Kiritimatiellia bacterium]|nr:LacI family DNA-binding transcriptional regulator [Kiritimatiellia bacterium]HMO99198.1 LacI family DNA-binding transcriptional regulator [Kiritimatiellia bacterium]HMP95785.1 LacI family DNA-binding transcriptional regulator [Kiritimatiellia bacterium]
MAKRTTIADIAREAGFSQSTVSLVINNNPRISEETRAKVLAAIEKHGYKPNIQARGLALRSSRIISVVMPDIPHVFADNYFGELLGGIYAGASEAGFKVLVDLANMKFIRTQEFLNMLDMQQADGMLFLGSTNYDQYLSIFHEKKYPFLLVNNYFPQWNIDYVTADYAYVAKLAADHLLGLGHRKIGIITGTNVQTSIDLLESFEGCLREAGIASEDMPWADGRFSEKIGFEAARVVMTLNPDLTAIMCGNDTMATGAMRYLRSRGLRVPEDVSVMGVENLPTSILTSPKLTTISNRLHDLGTLAAKQLLALTREEITVCQEQIKGELIVRESTGPAPVR